jgi:hypothetical protein
VPNDIQGQKALLRMRFGSSGWECRQILDGLDAVDEIYFDRVSQIHMDPRQGLWSRGRVKPMRNVCVARPGVHLLEVNV